MEKLGLTFTKRQVLTSDAMNKIVGKVNDVVDSANKLEILDLKVGGVETLKTEDKSTLVAAINELVSRIKKLEEGGGGLKAEYDEENKAINILSGATYDEANKAIILDGGAYDESNKTIIL